MGWAMNGERCKDLNVDDYARKGKMKRMSFMVR